MSAYIRYSEGEELIQIDEHLVEELRSAVNSDDIIRINLSNMNGKNEFNRICSVMDWLQVSFKSYNKSYAEALDGSIEFYNYVMLCDVIVQSFLSLSEIVGVEECVSTERKYFPRKINSMRLPYHHDQNRFPDANDLASFDDIEDDDSFFSKIRACFGAHVQNIGKAKSGRYVASWSGMSLHLPNAAGLLLYAYDIPGKDMTLDVPIESIDAYIHDKCNTMPLIIKSICDMQKSYIDKLKNESFVITGCVEKDVDIIIDEAKRRCRDNCYNGILRYIPMFFNPSVRADERLNVVRLRSKEIIAIIHHDLESMDCDYLCINDFLSDEYSEVDFEYIISVIEFDPKYQWDSDICITDFIDMMRKKFNIDYNECTFIQYCALSIGCLWDDSKFQDYIADKHNGYTLS